MQQLKSPQKTPTVFYDQTNTPQSSAPSTSTLLFCSSCCWPSRRNVRETAQNSECNSLKPPDKVVVYKRNSNSVRIKKSSTHSLYLSFNDLNRATSPTRNQLEVLSARYSDVDSINEQPYLTARTSRTIDQRRYKSMPTLVSEIRAEFLGDNHFENMKQEFVTFFRKFSVKGFLGKMNIVVIFKNGRGFSKRLFKDLFEFLDLE